MPTDDGSTQVGGRRAFNRSIQFWSPELMYVCARIRSGEFRMPFVDPAAFAL